MTNGFMTEEAVAIIQRLLGITQPSQDDTQIDVLSKLTDEAKSDVRMLLGLDESTLESYLTDDAKNDVLDFLGMGSYTVWYKKGDHGTFTEKKVEDLNYGDATPAAPTQITGDEGWTFTGWQPEVADTVTADATYVAQWEETVVDNGDGQ